MTKDEYQDWIAPLIRAAASAIEVWSEDELEMEAEMMRKKKDG